MRVQLNLPDVEDQTESGVEEIVDAAAADLPVLYPEDNDEDEAEYPGEDEVAEALAKAEAVNSIPAEYPGENEVAEALAKAEAVNSIPELQPIAEEPEEPEAIKEPEVVEDVDEPEEAEASERELVVSEWPNPVGRGPRLTPQG
jgi:hypothetical protein